MLAETGSIQPALLWLEQEADLIGDTSRVEMYGRDICYLVADEDELFRNAEHVQDFNVFESAMNDNTCTAIVIDRSFDLDYSMACTKPLLISEGCELKSGTSGMSGLFIDKSIIINRGKIELNSCLDMGDKGYLINYGVVGSPVYNEINAEALILNMGDMNLQYGQYQDAQIFNTGILRHEGYGEEVFLDIVFGGIYNYGDFTLVEDNSMLVNTTYGFNNMGKIRIEDGMIENLGNAYTYNEYNYFSGIINDGNWSGNAIQYISRAE